MVTIMWLHDLQVSAGVWGMKLSLILFFSHQVKRKPFVIPHHTITFATIVRNQQAEQEDRNKQVHYIPIYYAL